MGCSHSIVEIKADVILFTEIEISSGLVGLGLGKASINILARY